MSTWALVGVIAFALGTGLAGARAFARGARWTGLCLAAAALSGALLAGATRDPRPTVVVIVLDQPVGNNPVVRAGLRELVQRAVDTGAERVGLVAIGGTGGEVFWAEPGSGRTAEQVADELADRPRLAADLPEALSVAADAAAERVRARGAWGALRGTAGRVIVGVTDPKRWDRFQPAPVDDVLTAVKRCEGTVELIDLTRAPATATVEIAAPLGVPAGKPIAGSGAQLLVTVRSPALAGRAGSTAQVRVRGQLDAGAAVCPERRVAAHIGNGSVSFPLPVSAFRHPTDPARVVGFAAGFVLVELEVTVDGAPAVTATGSAYVPARRAEVWVACGPDGPADRLLAPRLLDAASLQTDSGVAQITKALGPVFAGPRALPALNCETVLDEDALRARLLNPGTELPAVLVLHDVSQSFWSQPVVERLAKAVENGLHLMVVGGVVLPADPALRAALERLLPATAVPDTRVDAAGLVPTDALPPRTVDRTPGLLLVFDYGRVMAFEREPSAVDVKNPGDTSRTVADGIGVQLEAARALLAQYGALVSGSLKRVGNEIKYVPHENDRVVVRVAPKVATADSLTASIFPSALEVRVAAAMHGTDRAVLDWSKSGLPSCPAPVLPGAPAETPNWAVVAFAADTPQPLPATAPGAAQVPVEYTVAGATGKRKYRQNPDGALAVPLLQGATVGVVKLGVGEYADGLGAMTVSWPGASPQPFGRFKLKLERVLTTKLNAELNDLGAGGRFPLGPGDAGKRLLRAGGKPFAATVDLTAPDALKQAKQAGAKLAAELLPIHSSPRAGMSMTAVGFDRFVDERVPHGFGPKQVDDPGFGAAYPGAVRWAAPRRYRALQLSPAYPAHARGVFVVGAEHGRDAARRAPVPLLVGGTAGNGAVAVLAYSPFETAESWWGVQDCVFKPGAAEPDLYGPERVVEFANLVSRVRGPNAELPTLRAVNVLDARGEMELVADFVPEQTRAGDFWRPVLTRADGAPGAAPLELVGVAWTRGEARFRLRPGAAARLFGGSGDPAVRAGLDFNTGRGLSGTLVVRRPTTAKWGDLTARDSVATAAGFSGGVSGAPDALGRPTRSLRPVWLLVLTTSLTGLFAARSYWRWGHWVRRGTARELPRPTLTTTDPDLAALGTRLGTVVDPPRARPRPGEVAEVRPLAPGEPIEAATQQALIRLILGIPTLIDLTTRARPRSLRVLVLVNCGASVRVGGRPGRASDKLVLCGFVAQLVCEAAWAIGAEVEVRAVGVAGDRGWGPAVARDRENGVVERVSEWGRAGPPVLPAVAPDAAPGTVVVYVSDFLTEDVPGLLGSVGEAGDGGTFAAALVHSREDERQVGVGVVGPPWAVVDRSVATPADVRYALAVRRDEVLAKFRAAGVPLAVVEPEMDAEQLLAEVLASGLIGRLGERG